MNRVRGAEQFRDRGEKNFNRGERNFDRGGDRPKLEWKTVHTIKEGNAVAEINMAISDSGRKMYSYSVGRMGREHPTKFLKQGEGNDAKRAIDQAEAWLAEAPTE